MRLYFNNLFGFRAQKNRTHGHFRNLIINSNNTIHNMAKRFVDT